MLVKKIGEFGLIDRITRAIKPGRGVAVGPGDDCAVVAFNAKQYQLLTCDMLMEDVDFTRKDDPALIGRKAVAVSISDIAACAGLPAYALVSMGIPKTATVKYVDKLLEGMLKISREFGVSIIGGDISTSDKLVIDVSMVGFVEKRHLVLRRGARPGDVVLVTGALGGSRKKKQFTFTPRVREARYLVQHYSVNAMIDISDGLVQDLGHILRQSMTGALLYESLIPVSKDARGAGAALYDGEDFELLIVMPRRDAKDALKKRPRDYFLIGEITSRSLGLTMIDKDNRRRPLKAGGYRHF